MQGKWFEGAGILRGVSETWFSRAFHVICVCGVHPLYTEYKPCFSCCQHFTETSLSQLSVAHRKLQWREHQDRGVVITHYTPTSG
jgi:hypothetical protein